VLAFRQRQFSFPFLVVVVLIPVVFRLGLAGSAIGVLLVAIPAVAYTQDGIGPLAVVSPVYWSMLLQIYFLILLATVYLLAAVLAKENRLAKELRESETRYRVLAETSQDVILRTSMDGVRTYVSPSLEQVTGWTEEQLPRPGKMDPLVHPSDIPGLSAFLEDMRREPGRRSLVFRLCKSSGEYAWLEAYVGTIFDHDNIPIELVWTIRDISLRVEHEENLKSQMKWAHALASTDSLTGLSNRRAFDEALVAEWSRCAESGDSLAVLMMDVDEFKLYNDSYGHQSGDQCLREIGSVIRDCIRQPGDVGSRYGGEEFAVILPRASIHRAQDVADRIRERVEALQIEHSSSSNGVVTLSAGVASAYPERGMPPDAVVHVADQGLYAAKRAGRNRVVLSM
jgi:diguanylate cyclase (GGDEF)-like protein/PAS domain S-box-containing protein